MTTEEDGIEASVGYISSYGKHDLRGVPRFGQTASCSESHVSFIAPMGSCCVSGSVGRYDF